MNTQDRTKVRHYRDRADWFFRTMVFCAEDRQSAESPYWNSVGLLAVHSAISLSDAILAANGLRCSAEDHKAAAELLEKICREMARDWSGVKHFRALLSRKSDFAYGDQRIGFKDLDRALLH